jgi:hypothetical protein
MENGKLLGYNSIGRRESPRTFPGIPLKRLTDEMEINLDTFFELFEM